MIAKNKMICGKYAGKTYGWVTMNDANYCKWVLEYCDRGPLLEFATWLENNKNYIRTNGKQHD